MPTKEEIDRAVKKYEKTFKRVEQTREAIQKESKELRAQKQ